jgi:hypothetical protein
VPLLLSASARAGEICLVVGESRVRSWAERRLLRSLGGGVHIPWLVSDGQGHRTVGVAVG